MVFKVTTTKLHLASLAIAVAGGSFLMVSACIRDNRGDLELDGMGKPIDFDEVSGYGKSSGALAQPQKKKGSGKANGKSAIPQDAFTNGLIAQSNSTVLPSTDETSLCQQAATQIAPTYSRLYGLLEQDALAAANPQASLAASVTVDACASGQGRKAAAQLLAFADQHTGRIGVILPLTGARAKFANYLVQGLRAAFADAGKKLEDVVVLEDSAGSAKIAEKRLAKLVLVNQVTMVIGGLEHAEAQVLAPWADALRLPLILLTRDRTLVEDKPFVFRVYPDEQKLATTLASAAQKLGAKRIAVLRPQGGSNDQLVKDFKKALQEKGGQVPFDILYTPGNFESMQAATRQLFRTDAAERRDEFAQVYKEAQKKAKEEGVAFDPRMVLLKPIVDFDALFIPDNFRSVRHLAKLIKFQQVDKLTLIGNHEWRSPALVEPWDEMLEGAVFADFIGSYANLPASIAAATLASPYFVQPSNVVPTDFKLIGYRAASCGRAVLDAGPVARRELPAYLAQVSGDKYPGFAKGPIFTTGRHANWPTYVFTAKKGILELVESDSTAAGTAAAADTASRSSAPKKPNQGFSGFP